MFAFVRQLVLFIELVMVAFVPSQTAHAQRDLALYSVRIFVISAGKHQPAAKANLGLSACMIALPSACAVRRAAAFWFCQVAYYYPASPTTWIFALVF